MEPEKTVMLVGPGRWGTTTPSLGIPVSFSEICRASAICEVVEMRDDLIPDVSLGTHFFNDLVEFDILYLALYPYKESVIFNRHYLEEQHNMVREYEEGTSINENVIRIIDTTDKHLILHADNMSQQYMMAEYDSQ